MGKKSESKSRIISLLITAILLIASLLPVSVSAEPQAMTRTVTVHKLLLTEDDFNEWDHESLIPPNKTDGYDGSQGFTAFKEISGRNIDEIKGVHFDIYKVGESDPIPGKSGLTEAGGLVIDTSDLEPGEYEIREDKSKSTYIGENGELLTGDKALPVKITLPMYKSDGTMIVDGHVYPKNIEAKPTIDKNFEGTTSKDTRSYFHGSVVPFEIKTTIPADTEYKTAHWSDNMTEAFRISRDNYYYWHIDMKVTIGGAPAVESVSGGPGDYVLTLKPSPQKGFDLRLTESGLEKINKKDTPTEVVIKYKAMLSDYALVGIPESNDVTFHYGNKPDHGNSPIPTKPINGELKAKKEWADGNIPNDVTVKFALYNAQTGDLVVRGGLENPVTLTADQINGINPVIWSGLDNDTEYKVLEEYNGYSAEYILESKGNIVVKNWNDGNPLPLNPDEPKVTTGGKKFVKTDGATGQRLRNVKFGIKRVRTIEGGSPQTHYISVLGYQERISWSSNKVYAHIFRTGNNGELSIVGLQNSDAVETRNGVEVPVKNEYYLFEFDPPSGYAQIPEILFMVDDNSYTSGNISYNPNGTELDATEVKNYKVIIPVTGGIGTAIFFAAGISIMATAVILKRRKAKECN